VTDVYVRSADGSDASDGLTWANAKATVAGALAIAAVGDTIFVADAHAETQATAITWTSSGTAASPVRILCVDDTGDPEPPTTLATTGTVTTTSTSAINFAAGFAYVYGLTFNCSSGAVNANIVICSAATSGWHLDICDLKLVATGAGAAINFGSSSNLTNTTARLVNCDIVFSAVGQDIVLGNARKHMIGGSIAATGSVPTTAISLAALHEGPTVFAGVDMSACSGNLVDISAAEAHDIYFRNCKLHATATIVTGTPVMGGVNVFLDNCDGADTNYRFGHHSWAGDVTHDISNFRTNGASDGTTPYSFKMVSSANTSFHFPLYSPWITGWIETTGSLTFTVQIINAGTTLTNAEVWLELEYLGTSGFPLALFADDAKADTLASAANQTSSSVSWTEALAGEVKQSLDVTVTVNEKGPFRARVALAKASQTIYVDPELTITSFTAGDTWNVGGVGGAFVVEQGAAAGGGIRLAGRGGLAG